MFISRSHWPALMHCNAFMHCPLLQVCGCAALLEIQQRLEAASSVSL